MPVVTPGTAGSKTLDWIRQQIESGTWPVGSRIPTENELVATIGVGRNTVREAVKSLTSTGVLEIRRGEGTYVLSTSEVDGTLGRWFAIADLVSVHELRRALELEAVSLACQRRTDADLDRLDRLLSHRSHRGTSPTELEEFAAADVEFHVAVVDAAHSPMLGNIFKSVRTQIRQVYDFNAGAYDPSDSDSTHEDLIEAIRDRNIPHARAAAEDYLDRVSRAIDLSHGRLAEVAGSPSPS